MIEIHKNPMRTTDYKNISLESRFGFLLGCLELVVKSIVVLTHADFNWTISALSLLWPLVIEEPLVLLGLILILILEVEWIVVVVVWDGIWMLVLLIIVLLGLRLEG